MIEATVLGQRKTERKPLPKEPQLFMIIDAAPSVACISLARVYVYSRELIPLSCEPPLIIVCTPPPPLAIEPRECGAREPAYLKSRWGGGNPTPQEVPQSLPLTH